MMQRIATSQSDVATLPVNIGGNDTSSGQANHDFRDMLESHKRPSPEFARPVDPISSETDRATRSKINAVKGDGQASLEQKNAESEEHISVKDQQSKVQKVTNEGSETAISRELSEQNSVSTEKQAVVIKSQDASANEEVVEYTDINPQQVSVEADQQEVDQHNNLATKHAEPIEIDWLTLLNNIEYAKSNDLKSAHGQKNAELAEEIAQHVISKTTSGNRDTDNADPITEVNLTNPQKDISKASGEGAENSQIEINNLQVSEQEKSYFADIQQTVVSLAKDLELSSEEQALLTDLATLIQRYQQSETLFSPAIDKDLSEQPLLAEIVDQENVSDSKLLQLDIEQLISQFVTAQQRQEQQQSSLTEFEQQQVSVAQIDKDFLAELLAGELLAGELLADAVTEQTTSTQPVPVELDIETLEQPISQPLISQPLVSEATEIQIKSEIVDLDLDLTSQQQILLAESHENISKSAVGISEIELPSESEGLEDIQAVSELNELEEIEVITEANGQEQEVILQSESAEHQAVEPKESSPILLNNGNLLNTLASLPENKLDLALRNLAQRLDELTQQSADNVTTQKSAVGKSLDTLETIGSAAFQIDFVKSLKQGVEDFKQKIKAGVQSSTDLNTLVTDALNSVNSLNKTAEIQPQQMQQVLSTFNHTLESGLRLSSALEQVSINSPQNQHSMVREVTQQTHFEQTKQIQQQILGQEKAINITRSEGHQQLVEKVRWMVNQNNLQADIRLDPPDLGSVKVRVNLNGESASVNFVVQSQQAREALEQAAPRLKELLDEQGIELGQSSVQQEQKETQQEQQNFAGGARDPELIEMPQGTVVEQTIVNGRLGAIDYFV